MKKIPGATIVVFLVAISLIYGREQPKQTNEPQPLVIVQPDYTDDAQFQKALEERILSKPLIQIGKMVEFNQCTRTQPGYWTIDYDGPEVIIRSDPYIVEDLNEVDRW